MALSKPGDSHHVSGFTENLRDRRILASWILAAAFGPAGALKATFNPTFPEAPAPLQAVLVMSYAYAGWATAWTFPPVWRWLYQHTLSLLLRLLGVLLGTLKVLLAEAVLLCFISIAALFAGMLYGTFGGGIREYLLRRSRLGTEGAGATVQRAP